MNKIKLRKLTQKYFQFISFLLLVLLIILLISYNSFNKKIKVLSDDFEKWTEKGFDNFLLCSSPKQVERYEGNGGVNTAFLTFGFRVFKKINLGISANYDWFPESVLWRPKNTRGKTN